MGDGPMRYSWRSEPQMPSIDVRGGDVWREEGRRGHTTPFDIYYELTFAWNGLFDLVDSNVLSMVSTISFMSLSNKLLHHAHGCHSILLLSLCVSGPSCKV